MDADGRLTLTVLDGISQMVSVSAKVTMGNLTLTAQPLSIELKDLSVIVDNSDSAHYSEIGTWIPSGLTGYNLNVHSRYTATQGAAATWTPSMPGGRYTVSFYKIVRNPGADNQLQLEVKHAGGTASQTVDASTGTSGWVELGTYDFAGDGTEFVRLTRVTQTSFPPAFEVYTRADSVKFDAYSLIGSMTSPTDPSEAPARPTLEFTFNHPLNPASVNGESVQIQEAGDPATILAVDVTLSADGKVLTATPQSDLLHDKEYIVRLGASLSDRTGMVIAPYSKREYQIKTRVDDTPPIGQAGLAGSFLPDRTMGRQSDGGRCRKRCLEHGVLV